MSATGVEGVSCFLQPDSVMNVGKEASYGAERRDEDCSTFLETFFRNKDFILFDSVLGLNSIS